MEDKFLTIKKTAEILGVSTLTLRNWDKSGKFKALRHPINNYRVYRATDIERFLRLATFSINFLLSYSGTDSCLENTS